MMKTICSPAPLWGIFSTVNSVASKTAHKGRRLLCMMWLAMASAGFAQIPLTGRVLMPDSSGIAYANVTLLGAKFQTTVSGRFTFDITAAMQQRLGIEIGDDLPIIVEKGSLVMLHPANGRVRIPRKPMSQEIEIFMAKKGSPLLIKSEAVLENIIRQRAEAMAATEKSGGESLRDVLAEEAIRLGLDKEQLRAAMNLYKQSLYKSADLTKRGLAALDDANEAKDAATKQQKFAEAKKDFHEAIRKDETDVAAGRAAEARLPDTYYKLGLTYLNGAGYDSAAFFFAKADSAKPNHADGLNKWGQALLELALYDQALQKFRRAYTIDSTAYGPNHSKVTSRLNNIGEALKGKGDYDGALAKYNEALMVVEKSFGRSHPHMAATLNNIAGALESKGDYDGAEVKYHEALTIFEKSFGREHPDVATGLNNIAGVLKGRGDYDGALTKYNEALAIYEQYWGHNHPKVAIELNNIAFVLNQKGDYRGALTKYDEALAIDERYFGRNHPKVAIRLNNIALTLKEKGDYDEAEAKYREALAIFEKFLGQKHPTVAIVLNNIGEVLRTKGDYNGALAKYNEALAIDERYFGRNHPDVAINLNNIALVLKEKGDYDQALAKYNEALAIDERYFGRSHPNVADRLNNIGEVLRVKGDYTTALAKYNEALAIDERYFSRDHPKVATRLNNIAFVLEKQGSFKLALAKYDSALAICEKFLGADHPNTRTVRNNRNRAYLASLPAQQQWQLRTQRLLALWQAMPQPLSASDSLNLLNGLGVGYTKLSKADSALLFLRQALPIAERLKEQEMLGMLYNNLGSAHKLKQDWPQARQWLEKSLRHNRAVVGDSAAVLAYTYFHLAGVAQAESQANLSREYAQKSLALAERHKLSDLRKEVEALLRQKR